MIVRIPKDRDYAQISNWVLCDDRLSWKARGILAYLLSKPDGWEVMITNVVNEGPDGRSAVRAGLAELEEIGYIVVHEQEQQDDGRFDSVKTDILECPTSGWPKAQVTPDADYRTRETRQRKTRERIIAPDKGLNAVMTEKTIASTPRERPRNLIFEALCEEEGVDWTQNNTGETGKINKSAGILKKMTPVPTVDEIHARAATYKKDWSHLTFTALGLVSNWSKFAHVSVAETPVAEPVRLNPELCVEAYRLANDGEVWYHPGSGQRKGSSDHPRHYFNEDGSALVIR